MTIRRFAAIAVGSVIGVGLLGGVVAIVWISLLDRSNGRVAVSGTPREYLLHVPKRYDPSTPTPLVVSLHAGATWPDHQRNLSRWDRLADEQGFIVVFPAGTPQLLNVARIWHSFDDGQGLAGDVWFLSELLDTLQATYNIDPDGIYVNGMSNGAGMAFVLSCRLADRIAAVGLVAPAQSLPEQWCVDQRPLPVIAFHGTADPIVPYEGGLLGDPFNPVKQVFPAINDFMSRWARRNGCGSDAVDSVMTAEAVRRDYPSCIDNADVVLVTLPGGGHSWPGGKPPPEWRVGRTIAGVDATAEMWRFFRDHPREAR